MGTMSEWQVPELGSWQQRLTQGFANQEAQLQHVQQRIHNASTACRQLEEENNRLRSEGQLKEEMLQSAAERVAQLRAKHALLAKKNQDVGEFEKRMLDVRERQRAEYISRLRQLTATNLSSRRALKEALFNKSGEAKCILDELEALIVSAESSLHPLVKFEGDGPSETGGESYVVLLQHAIKANQELVLRISSLAQNEMD